ncbi:hypothetical protein ACS0TY_009167 [Phlomoides rotata]
MPPSPVMRASPGRELKAENHKRGRSLESGVLYREKEGDLDLALFNEVQNKERESFLLQSNDNFDDIFPSKLRHSSDYTLGISIPARGESSDLLNAEGDKNDYDWLITPPETPLFSCLDDEVPPFNLAPRGRPRSQPVSISRSPTMENAYGSSRGSASPHRLSPSQGSGNSTLQSRSRPSSATHSSPPPSMRQSSPSRRLSPSPSKITSAPRSSTPTPRRVSTGSPSPSRVRGTSPVKTSRGNSASPKIRAWQSNIPGFSSEVPPNLRTSLADRPASYVRGSSPASSNGSRYGRKSMSPTASRSVTSPHSHDRDPFNSYSKGSVASSGDDDLDSLQSMAVSSSDRSSRNTGAFPNNSPIKKPAKVLSSSPKRSLDLGRQMDRKVPHNMFRPLLSGVPSSTFHVGKTSAHNNRSLTSRNSSITTSSNQAENKAHDTEGSEQDQEDVTNNHVKGHYQDMDDEVFVIDPADSLNEVTESRILEDPLVGQRGEIDGPPPPLGVPGNRNQPDATTAMDPAVSMLYTNHDTPDMATCSKCGRTFHSAEIVTEGDLHLCLECKSLELNSTISNQLEKVKVGESNIHDFVQIVEHGSLEVLDQSASIPEPLRVACTGQTESNHLDKIANETQNSYSDSSQNYSIDVFEEGELPLAVQKVIKQPMDGEMGYQQLQYDTVNCKSRLDVSGGEGISLLLRRSSSMKGYIVQSRSFTASNTSYDDFSYARDSANSMRSSKHTSASVSSSIDLGSSRLTETRIHRQLSGHKSDSENSRYEAPVKHKRSNSSMSGASGHMSQVPSVAPSCREDSFELVGAHINKELEDETCVGPHEQSLSFECAEADSTCTDFESNAIFKTNSELSSCLMNDHSVDHSVLSVLTSQERTSHENCDGLINDSHNLMNPETLSTQSRIPNQEDDAISSSRADRVDAAEVPHPSPLDAISEIEIEIENDVVFSDSHSDVDSTNSRSRGNELQHYDAITAAIEEFDTSHVVLEESKTLSEDIGQTKAKSLTLEEATDAILFCSSIVHSLAYEAANIAIDNKTSALESLQPAVTFVGKSIDRRDKRLRKRSPKSQKTRQKMLETEAKPPPRNAEMNEKVSPHNTGTPDNGDSMKPPKPESKCNCIIM